MSIRQDLLAGMIRPEILRLAGRRKLLDKCFNEFLPTPDARDADGNLTGYLENGLAARLQARCKADARALQDPRGAVAQTARAPGFTAGCDPLKGSGNNPVSMSLALSGKYVGSTDKLAAAVPEAFSDRFQCPHASADA